MPRTPGPMPPRWSGSGPTCRRCAGAWAGKVGGFGWVRQAHAASISSAPQPVGCGRVVLEDTFAMVSAERFQMLSLARSPRNPQDRRPSIGSLAVLGHPCYSPFLVLPVSKHWREDPDPVPRRNSDHRAPPARASPPLPPSAPAPLMHPRSAEGQPGVFLRQGNERRLLGRHFTSGSLGQESLAPSIGTTSLT
ncbi:MAG: hypothetical protein QOJ93_3236 [Actinomycetota bacterium]|nr:hypothetical protein [Actinomycetota bacterium]